MLAKVLTVVVLLTFFGCETKEYKKSENSNITVVSQLNKGNYQDVISELGGKSDLTPREKYYLASAQSEAGGVDVFSMYPVMEIELFHKSALDWNDLSKDKNPYLRFVKNQQDVNDDYRTQKREEEWKKYEPELIQEIDLASEPPTFEQYDHVRIYDEDHGNFIDVTRENFAESEKAYEDLVKKILGMKLPQNESLSTFKTESKNILIHSGLSYYYLTKLIFELRKRHYFHPEEEQGNLVPSSGWELLYMNILWNTYEAIPVMKKLPQLTDEQQEKISEALETYLSLVHEKEFHGVSVKNMLILTSISLMAIYKESFDLGMVKDMQDMMCAFEPDTLINSYSIIRRRVIFLSKVFQALSDSDLKEYSSYKGKLDNVEGLIPEELTEDQIANFRHAIHMLKYKQCIKG